jgi:hypothetical protein
MFPATFVEHVITEESDHLALVIHVQIEDAVGARKGPKGFVFEEMWTKHESYEDMIKNGWESNAPSSVGINGLWRQLHDMSTVMQRWSFDTFGSVKAELKSLRTKLEEARTHELVSGPSLEVREIESKLHEMYEREEIMYRQRSRQDWLKAGDRNTRYFQNRASHRKRKNTVRSLRREDGSVCNTNEGMRDMALVFYKDLYNSEGSTQADQVLNLIDVFVNDDMNRTLTIVKLRKPFSKWDLQSHLGRMDYLRYFFKNIGLCSKRLSVRR